jgi:type IV pilus assembly protein PilY1
VLNAPNYISPIKEACQANFIVLLTDGEANSNHSASLIRSKTGVASCQATFANGSSVASGEACGLDLVKYLNDVDQAPDVSGDNNVVTYTIGFNISNEFLRDMADAGGGRFFEASSSSELAAVFQAIFTDVLSSATSFAAPSLSVNAFNRLEDRNEVYFSLFEPAVTARWNGNIKKFQLCQSSTDACVVNGVAEVGDVLDARTPPAKAVGDDGRILDTALSFWTSTQDGPNVLEGGTGNQVPTHTARRVFTFSDEALQSATPPAGTVSFFPASADLGATKNRLLDTDGDGIIDGLSGTTADKLIQTQELLGMGSATPAELKAQIDWIRGKDVDGVFSDTVFAENRYSFSDPLHGNPLAITYGGTADNPILKLMAGTNDGGIRLINSNSGVEEWIFYPPSLLPLQTTLRANPATGKEYGVDGSATPWIRDAGLKIGVIEPDEGDFVRVFIGQRRGGSHYWGLDITPTTEIPEGDLNGTGHVTPKLMWRIRGGTPEYPMLGQTWSKPFLTTMLVGTTLANQAVRKTVLIFAGGYEAESQDSGFAAANSRGNAIYIADAETGERLFYVAGPDQAGTGDDHSTPDRGLRVPDMLYPIPSDVAAFDADGDGSVDRVYVGDTGGQMWRIDFRPNREAGASNDGILAVAGKLAAVSSATAEADKRKFFYPPSIIQVRGAGSHSNADYDLVSAVTGNRANPLNKSVQDRFYAFRDYALGPLLDSNGDGLAEGYTTIRGDLVGAPTASPAVPASTFNDMLDFTLVDDPSDLADPNDFVTSNGYYIRLDTGGAGMGEKGLAAPTTIAGRLFFTTYLPEGVVSSTTCSLAEGRGQLYGLNAITGAAIFNWDNDAGGNITAGDRVYTLGSGIPSNAVPVFFPEKVMLLVGVGGGAEAVDPGIALPQGRTYWFQQ